jgi:hypothetical protein
MDNLPVPIPANSSEFREVIERALDDPALYVDRIADESTGEIQLEPINQWRARAVEHVLRYGGLTYGRLDTLTRRVPGPMKVPR